MAFLDDIFVNLDRFDWDEENCIGSGAFGFCYTVKDRDNPEKLLCAKITQNVIEESKDQEELLREVVILKNIKHNAILAFVGFNLYDFQQKPRPTIITEYLPKGALDDMIKKENKKEAPENWNATKKQICIIGIAAAMRYLHRRKLMHRDLKPANVLLDENLYPKVCDFGFARAYSQEELDTMTRRVGTPIYMAPEVISGEEHYTNQCDVYSFAILAYEISTGIRPFDDFLKTHRRPNINDLVKWVCTLEKRPKFDNCNVNANFQELIKACWSPKPNDRPTFDYIYDKLVDDRDLVINNQVNLDEVQKYISSIQDDSTDIGKAKLDFNDPLTIYDYRPKNADNAIPDKDEDRIKMLNDFMQNGFSGDIDVEITLFTKMLGSISTNRDPTNFSKITFFANKLVQDGNKKASIFLKNAFGEIIAEGKNTLSKEDIPNRKVTSLNISPTVETIQAETFAGMKNLNYVNLPPSIKKIGQFAFKGCKNLIWVSFNNKVTEIEQGVFEDCTDLKYVELSSSITVIKEGAFRKCTSLEQIHIPSSVKDIEKSAFHGCKKLKVAQISLSTNYASASSFPLGTRIIKK